MTDTDAVAKSNSTRSDALRVPAAKPPPVVPVEPRPIRTDHPHPIRVVPFLMTGVALALAGVFAWAMWQTYMARPWTRDGIVRAYVVTETPEVSGKIVSLPVVADQFVRKGDLLMVIEPTDYEIAVSDAEAAVEQAKANLENKQAEATRREKLTTLSTSVEEQQTFVSAAQVADASYRQSLARLAQARVNLARTRITSPVNGYVTNLTAQIGDYASSGQRVLSLVDIDSFWVDGYFEETLLGDIHLNDPATMSLMGRRGALTGHVVGISRGIAVPNAQSDAAGLATVNPVFTWIRLAQRVPVRIAIDSVPPGVALVIGLTTTVEIGRSATPNPSVMSAPIAPKPAAGQPGATSGAAPGADAGTAAGSGAAPGAGTTPGVGSGAGTRSGAAP